MATARTRSAAKPGATQTRTALVVAGMHRSGTSAMARLLSLAGGTLPGNIIQPGPDNPTGFWEPADMVGLNDRILASVGSRWDDVFGHRVGPAVWERRAEWLDEARAVVAGDPADAAPSVLKDPRASLMIRFWDEALRTEGRRPIYVVMVRHPLEVAASITARGDASEATAVMAWTACMLAVERDTRGLARIFVDYDDLLSDWRAVLDRVRSVSGDALPALTPEAEAAIDGFLSPDQRHHRADADLATRGDLWSGALTTLSWMRAAATGAEPDATQLDDALVALERQARLTAPALRDLRAEVAALPALKLELAELRKENAALRDLANTFHAEADHNGRHWAASRDMVAHLTHELSAARDQAERFRKEAESLLPIRREIGLAETRALRQQTQNRELIEALETERQLLANARGERASVQARLDTLEAEAAEARRMLQAAVAEAVDAEAARRAEAEAQLIEEKARLSETETRLAEAEALAADRAALLDERERALDDARAQAEAARGRIVALKTTASWKVTRPLRVIAKRLKTSREPGRS